MLMVLAPSMKPEPIRSKLASLPDRPLASALSVGTICRRWAVLALKVCPEVVKLLNASRISSWPSAETSNWSGPELVLVPSQLSSTYRSKLSVVT